MSTSEGSERAELITTFQREFGLQIFAVAANARDGGDFAF